MNTSFLYPTYPRGRCINLGPEMRHRDQPVIKFYILELKDEENIQIFFQDPINGAQLLPNQFQMRGDSVEIGTDQSGLYKKYKTKISKFQHPEGDPKFDCKNYCKNETYNDCIENELVKKFQKLLGCHPPLISEKKEKMCNTTFNMSTSDDTVKNVLDLIDNMFTDFHSTSCKSPCTYYKYDTRLLYSFTINRKENRVKIVLDRVVDITLTSFLLSIPGFFVGLGGAISAGRTLFWFVVSAMGFWGIIKNLANFKNNSSIHEI